MSPCGTYVIELGLKAEFKSVRYTFSASLALDMLPLCRLVVLT